MTEAHRTDVLILGGGLAGAAAALAAREEGASVCLALKGLAGESGNSARAGGGLAAVLEEAAPSEDSPEALLLDTMRSGWFLSDPLIARAFAEGSGPAVEELGRLGVPFRREDGRIAPMPVPGHSRPRAVRVPGGGGVMMAALRPHLRESGALLLEETALLRLLRDAGGRVVGADLARLPSGDRLRVRARATVLAMGGPGGLYPTTTNHPAVTGAGYAAALEAGCRLRDMEFVQFTPTALAAPPELRGRSTGGFALSFEEARITNALGERFMARYAPDVMERAKRDILSRAMHREIVEGRGSPSGGVYLDLRGVPLEPLRGVIGEIMDALAAAGLDVTERPIEIAPAAHSCMGGVAIGPDGRTGTEGLFAAGENAGGLHGANRLASNALSASAVFGLKAGRAAAGAQGGGGAPVAPPLTASPEEDGPRLEARLEEAVRTIRRAMFEAGGIEREAASLERARGAVAGLREMVEAARPPAALLPRLAEVRQMRLTAEAMLCAMALREESRGAHFRSDFPERDDERWLANVYVLLEDGTPRAERAPVSASARDLAQRGGAP